MNKSLYIHIPFCRKKCFYCDFYSLYSDAEIMQSYISLICRQIKEMPDEVSTVYVGGGTPTVLPIKSLEKMLSCIAGKIKPGIEFTVEANPDSLTVEKIRLFKYYKVNRISIGVQSFSDKVLLKLGRVHSAVQAEASVVSVLKEGIKNISLDLIFGIWDQTFKEWQYDLNKACSFPIKHLSLYTLTCEKNTSFYKLVKKGKVKTLPEAKAAQMYSENQRYLKKKGFVQYEVSNYARKGFECRHNSNYWENGEYLGLGPSAVSYQFGVRTLNVSNLKEYMQRAKEKKNIVASTEKLSKIKRAKETAALKIRTREGIMFSDFIKKTGFDFLKLYGEDIEELISSRLLSWRKYKGEFCGVCLTRKGFLFSDSVSSAFL